MVERLDHRAVGKILIQIDVLLPPGDWLDGVTVVAIVACTGESEQVAEVVRLAGSFIDAAAAVRWLQLAIAIVFSCTK